jgi:archaellum component FlaF (FlaF/FlaG flagellin family)
MENALTGIIIIGVMILAILGLSEGALSAQANLVEASRAMQERLSNQARTNVEALGASTSVGGNAVYITVKNTGTTKLADYAHWDVIVDYTSLLGHQVSWYAYGTWTKQIYAIAATSTFEKLEPDVFNPGEEMIITVPVGIAVAGSSTNVATVSTPNGIAVSVPFVGSP